VTSDRSRALPELTSFTATVSFAAGRTVVEVYPPGAPQPVARLVKAGAPRARAAYELFTGPGLRDVTGTVSPSGALDADGTPVGIVNLSGGKKPDAEIHPMSGARHSYVVGNPMLWRVVQAGMPALAGHAGDRATRLTFNPMTGFINRLGIPAPTPGIVRPMTFEYLAQDSPGFTIRQAAGWKPRFEVTVADSRVDRRMIFAVLTALAIHTVWTLRGEAIDSTAPFRRT
jgi:hypothetical protein